MRLHLLSVTVATLLLTPLAAARAAGPKEVAVADRSLWPAAIRSAQDFDRASRVENLVFAKVLGEMEAEASNFQSLLGVKQVRAESVRRWLEWVKGKVAENLRAARAACSGPKDLGCAGGEPTPESVASLGGGFTASLAPEYKGWLEMAERFYRAYLKEQLRLAALFPAPTSEILTFPKGELTGSDWPDRQFLLTFDDGPTAAGGGTDRLVTLLQAKKASGIFFVLGNALQTRLDKGGAEALQALYRGQCVGSHGQEHKSHQKLASWKESVEGSRALIASLGLGGGEKVLFRPPYGQRTEELSQFLASQGTAVMLWNIDSQDWNAGLAAGPMGDRLVSLMLLWRRGILLFHDVHGRVHEALPGLLDFASAAGLSWKDCKEL